MGLVSLLSPVKIRRDAEACIDCGKCARVCPSALPVDRLVQIRSVECSACMICVAACPVEHGLQLAALPRTSQTEGSVAQRWRGRIVRPQAVAAIVGCVLVATVVIARMTGHWRTNLPEAIYAQLVSHANEVTHPGM